MPLRERQEIQEMLRRLSAWHVARISHTGASHTAAYPPVPSELNPRKPARQEGDNRGRLQ